MFDPAQNGGFSLEAPPAPWIDLGWISGFSRKSGTKVEAIRSGAPASAQSQVRTEIDATVALQFQSWGKLQLALAAGTQQMNLLKTASGAMADASGGPAVPAVSLSQGSTASVLMMAPTDAAQFTAGEWVAVDVDYTATTGFIGSGVSGAYAKGGISDVDYVRRITLNVARIVSIVEGTVTLEKPLIAGAPVPGMRVSGVAGFCDREGSSFFQEWSGLFVAEGQQGERVIWHYPRLQAMAGTAEAPQTGSGGYEALKLAGVFRALAVKDPVDGENVVCFRSFVSV